MNTTTEYIGQRYVPIFADPVQWDNQREYEPLTIVMHDGDSYTSKRAVPVSIDITDETYWVKTSSNDVAIERVEGKADKALNELAPKLLASRVVSGIHAYAYQVGPFVYVHWYGTWANPSQDSYNVTLLEGLPEEKLSDSMGTFCEKSVSDSNPFYYFAGYHGFGEFAIIATTRDARESVNVSNYLIYLTDENISSLENQTNGGDSVSDLPLTPGATDNEDENN